MTATSVSALGHLCLLATSLALAACSGQQAIAAASGSTAAQSQAVRRDYAQINGVRLYYELRGDASGVPLVLLNGGGSTIESNWGPILPYLAAHRRVIALDEQNHGRSGHRDVPERFADSARDVAALLRHLGVAQADVMGFSNGASVGMQLTLQDPALVRKLVFTGSMTKRSGAPPQFWEWISKGTFADLPQDLKDAFLAVNPDQAQLRDMYEKDAERMRNFVETGDDLLRTIAAPTLVIAGDRDVLTPEHAVEISRLLPNARLIILPGAHGSFLGLDPTSAEYAPALSAQLVERFLDERY